MLEAVWLQAVRDKQEDIFRRCRHSAIRLSGSYTHMNSINFAAREYHEEIVVEYQRSSGSLPSIQHLNTINFAYFRVGETET